MMQQQNQQNRWVPMTGFYYLEGDHVETEHKHSDGSSFCPPPPPPRRRLAITPYYYSFEVAAKGRWVGRPLLDVFLEEFQHHDRAYYEAAIGDGRMWVVRTRPTAGGPAVIGGGGAQHQQQEHAQPAAEPAAAAVAGSSSNLGGGLASLYHMPPRSQWWNGRPPQLITDKDVILGRTTTTPPIEADGGEGGGGSPSPPLTLQHGDIIHHMIHKHELTSFIDSPLHIVDVSLLASHGLIAVDKPSSLPAHPSGRFFRISMTEILTSCFVPNMNMPTPPSPARKAAAAEGKAADGGEEKDMEASADVVTCIPPAFPRDDATVEYILKRFCFGGDDKDSDVEVGEEEEKKKAALLPPLLAASPALLSSYNVLLDHYLRWGPTISAADRQQFYEFLSPAARGRAEEEERRSKLASAISPTTVAAAGESTVPAPAATTTATATNAPPTAPTTAPPTITFAPCYRLDRATSGIILVSCTSAAASWIGRMLQAKTKGHVGGGAGGVEGEAIVGGSGSAAPSSITMAKKVKQPKLTKQERKAEKLRLSAAQQAVEAADGTAQQQEEKEVAAGAQLVADENDNAAAGVVGSTAPESGADTTAAAQADKLPQKQKEDVISTAPTNANTTAANTDATAALLDEAMLGKSYLAKCRGNLFEKMASIKNSRSCNTGEEEEEEDGADTSSAVPLSVVLFNPLTGAMVSPSSSSSSSSSSLLECIRCAYPIYGIEASTFSIYSSSAEALAAYSASTAAHAAAHGEGNAINTAPDATAALVVVVVGAKRTREEQHEVEKAALHADAAAAPLPPAPSATATSFRAGGGKAKEALTVFYPLAYDSGSDATVVRCYPLTGRTHQIRVHLGGMGHPITNDHKYLRHYGHWRDGDGDDGENAVGDSGVAIGGEELRQKTLPHRQQQAPMISSADVVDPHAADNISLSKVYYDEARIPNHLRETLATAKLIMGGVGAEGEGENGTARRSGSDDGVGVAAAPTALRDPLCDECLGKLPITAFGDEGSTIYLHAYEYTLTVPPPAAAGGGQSRRVVFTAPLPPWASAVGGGQ